VGSEMCIRDSPEEIRVFPAHDYRGNVCATIGERSVRTRASRGVRATHNLGMPPPEKIQEAPQANVSAIDDDSVKFPSFAQLTQVGQLTPHDLHQRLFCGESARAAGSGLGLDDAVRWFLDVEFRASLERPAYTLYLGTRSRGIQRPRQFRLRRFTSGLEFSVRAKGAAPAGKLARFVSG